MAEGWREGGASLSQRDRPEADSARRCSQGVAPRDLHADNLLLAHPGPDAPLKVPRRAAPRRAAPRPDGVAVRGLRRARGASSAYRRSMAIPDT